MDIFATIIATAAKVNECRAAQSGADFIAKLSATGEAPATHYASSGFIKQADIDALAGLCAITTGDHAPMQAIAAAGLKMVLLPPPAIS